MVWSFSRSTSEERLPLRSRESRDSRMASTTAPPSAGQGENNASLVASNASAPASPSLSSSASSSAFALSSSSTAHTGTAPGTSCWCWCCPTWLVHKLFLSKDWWSVWISFIMFVPVIAVTLNYHVDALTPKNWTSSPLDAWTSTPQIVGFTLVLVWSIAAITFALSTISWLSRHKLGRDAAEAFSLRACVGRNVAAIGCVSLIGLVARWLGEQASIDRYGITFEVWALVFGMLISNFRLIPKWLEPGKEGEFFIKVGLVLLGLDLRSVAALGGPGLLSSWVPTPMVIVASLLFAFLVLKMGSERSLAFILVCGTCICGSSAATAIHGCVGGETEVLALCIAIINLFTIPQMIGLPYLAYYAGMPLKVAAAWLGSSVDATGAVVAAASVYDQLADVSCEDGSGDGGDGTCAVDVASTVKIVQNILIGPVAVAVSLYWIRSNAAMAKTEQQQQQQQHNGSGGDELQMAIVENGNGTTATASDKDNANSVGDGDGDGYRDDGADGVGSIKLMDGEDARAQPRAFGNNNNNSSSNSNSSGRTNSKCGKQSIALQLWEKFPKFVLGFLFCSTIITVINASVSDEEQASLKVGVQAVSKWFFCLGFVGIGLSSDLRKLASKMQGGKPILLYVLCQLLDLLLKLGFAYISFDVIDK
ncbi:hypothetical protein PTSG_07999 [Salpingoeca rosetta]|uniref:Uncharacterized protein n=1 Tax=Salpingoeca rosetta (strain ATCC 50818 / BSB-021) TaxID=946362 RepID=F2UHP9_SALR5|nr:uncharacterized protein PTSG_07999 [Salpingoeca rosetta]EGD76648.1 hypothetical protein PTSG_07999 [Salpingoeca rosetta]|eukprot:XP_004991020.1 hypothetical protein PTSG_07999 [Salpingoeca rosetta]